MLLHLTHHKCGTRWINSICHEICFALGKRWESASNPGIFNHDLAAFARTSGVDFLSFTNARYAFIGDLDDYRGFHVIRDPRDILVSSYFSSLKTHTDSNWPALTAHRQQLQEASTEEGLLLEMGFIADVFEALRDWNYGDDRILEVKMESLMQDNYSGLCRVFAHLGLLDQNDGSTSAVAAQTGALARLLVNRLYARTGGWSLLRLYPPTIPVLHFLGVVHRNRFEAKARGRSRGQENKNSHYRKGQAGDWANHFTPKVEKAFKDTLGDLVVALGYDETNDWHAAS